MTSPEALTTDQPADGLLLNARLLTLAGDRGWGLIEDGAMAWRDGVIIHVGEAADVPAAIRGSAVDIVDGHGQLVTPGLIDCHTHLVFAGDRSVEFEQRLQGVSYEAIARAGGGILSSVNAVRAASEDQLLAQSLPRARALLADGVTTLEIKSGYGLDFDNERKMLRVARCIAELLGIAVRCTFLGAHALPPEFAGRADDYVDAVCSWIPRLQAEDLIDAVDAFCEGIGFSPEQTRRVFDTARECGIPVKLHADQLSDLGGAGIVADFGGLSADHVEYSSEDSVAAMARAGSVAVLLPGAFLFLRETQLPPIEAFRANGVPMAVATDLNPGTAPLLSLRLAMGLACSQFRLTPEESIRGATVNAARALGFADRGQLNVGKRADFVQWNIADPAGLTYWMGGSAVVGSWAAGRRII